MYELKDEPDKFCVLYIQVQFAWNVISIEKKKTEILQANKPNIYI